MADVVVWWGTGCSLGEQFEREKRGMAEDRKEGDGEGNVWRRNSLKR
jgi:hypothetical protein